MPWCKTCRAEVALPCVKCRTLRWIRSRQLDKSMGGELRFCRERAAVGDPCPRYEVGVIELSTRTRDYDGMPSDHFRCSRKCGFVFSRESERPKGKPNRGGHA